VPEGARQDVTLLLQNANQDDRVSDKLLPLVYNELRRMAADQMARERPGQTLQPTALVHEAYLRLVGSADIRWENRAHFFAVAARSMRQILVNRAIKKKTDKRGGERPRQELIDAMLVDEPPPERLLALDEALKKLEQIDSRKGRIVMLRYFAGLSIADTAKALELSTATIKREWQFARTWLHREMTQ